jgi:hypothetical protein
MAEKVRIHVEIEDGPLTYPGLDGTPIEYLIRNPRGCMQIILFANDRGRDLDGYR